MISFFSGMLVTAIVAVLVVKNNKAKAIKLISDIDIDAIVAKAGTDAKAIADAIKAKIAALK